MFCGCRGFKHKINGSVEHLIGRLEGVHRSIQKVMKRLDIGAILVFHVRLFFQKQRQINGRDLRMKLEGQYIVLKLIGLT